MFSLREKSVGPAMEGRLAGASRVGHARIWKIQTKQAGLSASTSVCTAEARDERCRSCRDVLQKFERPFTSSRTMRLGSFARAPDSTRPGSMDGASSCATSLDNGIDCAYLLNSSTFKSDDGAIDHFEESVDSLLPDL